MDEMNVTEALLKAILELIMKCESLEELRESVKRIIPSTHVIRRGGKKSRRRGAKMSSDKV